MMNDVPVDLDAFHLVSQAVDFGQVFSDQESVLAAFIHNGGNDTLSVGNIFVSSEVFSGDITLEPVVLPGDSLQVDLSFVPGEQDVFADSLSMEFTGLTDPVTMFILEGQGITYPAVSYELTSFGVATTQDEEQSFEFVLTNTGDFPLDFSLEVDATWLNIVEWLTVSPESGQITGNEMQTITANIINVGQIDAGTFLLSLIHI